MAEEFYIEGRKGAMVCVTLEKFRDGRIGIYASAERLSQAAFRQMLKAEFPNTKFVVEYGRSEHKAVQIGRKE
jgi:hypothetical protein